MHIRAVTQAVASDHTLLQKVGSGAAKCPAAPALTSLLR
jgi:hypothetical protein